MGNDVEMYEDQVLLVPDNIRNMKVCVIGAGSVGSHVVVGLAKMGFDNVIVFDFDKIEKHNLPSQFYPRYVSDGNNFKTLELANFVNVFSGNTVLIDSNEFGYNDFLHDCNIFIIAVDSIASRLAVLDEINEIKNGRAESDDKKFIVLDGRMAGKNVSVFSFNMTDDAIDLYKESLKGEFSEIQCGGKTHWFINAYISSLLVGELFNRLVVNNTGENSYKYKEIHSVWGSNTILTYKR